jgi:hypothetical protein
VLDELEHAIHAVFAVGVQYQSHKACHVGSDCCINYKVADLSRYSIQGTASVVPCLLLVCSSSTLHSLKLVNYTVLTLWMDIARLVGRVDVVSKNCWHVHCTRFMSGPSRL